MVGSIKGGWRGSVVGGKDIKAEGWSLCQKDKAVDRRHRHKRLRAVGKAEIKSQLKD